MYPLTLWVKRLLIANVAVHVVATSMPAIIYAYGPLVPSLIETRPWTLLTYMFLHAPGLSHIFFNMIGLFFFGPRLEERLGGPDFLKLYLWGGVGGAVFSFIFSPQYPVVGASAAVYGVLLGFAMFWPRERVYIWGILPLEAWLLATLLVVGSLWSGVTSVGTGVAHFAHLGGLAFGFGYLKRREWRRGEPKRNFQSRIAATPPASLSDRTALDRWEAIDTALLHELNRQEVEALLRRVRAEGVRGLSQAERAFLDRMATQH
jgi:membrane associated rhomboid family serine protease